MSKRMEKIKDAVDTQKRYSIEEAVEILKKCPPVKFDQSIDVAIKMGIDPKKSELQVRGTVTLPHGTGKKSRVLVFAKGDKVQEAITAGADYAGNEELLQKVEGGWTDFDVVISTPDMMRDVGKLGKVLGPRGLMPTPKAGTVAADVANAVKEIKKGKVEFKFDKHGVINNLVGKLSFGTNAIAENLRALLNAILKAKPSAAKGQYIESIALTSTMGPGVKIDLREVPTI